MEIYIYIYIFLFVLITITHNGTLIRDKYYYEIQTKFKIAAASSLVKMFVDVEVLVCSMLRKSSSIVRRHVSV